MSLIHMLKKHTFPQDLCGSCTVYLLHFHNEIGSQNIRGKAQHYVGIVFSPDPDALKKRLWCHRKGYTNSAKLTRAFFREGIPFFVGHIWRGVDPRVERLVKHIHKSRLVCEICQDLPFF